jgi:hypothetical protein
MTQVSVCSKRGGRRAQVRGLAVRGWRGVAYCLALAGLVLLSSPNPFTVVAGLVLLTVGGRGMR